MAELDDGLFLIDGEDAGSTPWEFDSVIVGGSNTFALDVAAKNNGTYGYKASFVGSPPDRNSRGIKTLSDPSTIYVRAYVFLSAGFAMGAAYENLQLLALVDGMTDIIVLGVYEHDGGELARWWKISEVGGVGEENDTTNFSLNAWHYLEIKFVAGTGSDGIVECRVDGTVLFGGADTGLSSSALAPDTLQVGAQADRGQEPVNGSFIYFDDIKAATDDWVGAYSDAGGGIIVLRRRRM